MCQIERILGFLDVERNIFTLEPILKRAFLKIVLQSDELLGGWYFEKSPKIVEIDDKKGDFCAKEQMFSYLAV